MAKRKRLTPANPNYLDDPPAGPDGAAADETRPFSRPPSRAPIAEIARETSSAAALGELSRSMEEARAQGRMIVALALDDVAPEHLVRDRMGVDDDEFAALVESLAARGQQTPVEVVDRGGAAEPRYGLISGWRRLAALRRLAEEGRGDGEVLAVIRAPDTASDAYVAMVEENEIRVGLSYYERARIAVKAAEEGVFADTGTALRGLFGNVSRAKRSKIRSFTEIVVALDGALRFPTRLAERAGLDLARRLAEDPDLARRLRADLEADPPIDAEDELTRLSRTGGDKIAAGAKSGGRKGKAARAAGPGTETGTGQGGRVVTAYNPERGEITLSGPGVNAALRAALDRWLAGG